MIFQGALHIVILLIYLFFIGISIYCLVLFVKLARRGILALDIYILQNKQKESQEENNNKLRD
ncbi:MAG: hypothetical protein CVU84_03915 [Firmicutes bacterium HGW-Firmicutes-1]|nr:MAG: hypothetical protein CVU84_03915 [Firmicutes bacterium HGW-Firmicutes-1]